MVGGWIEGREVWKGGVLVSCWEEFGRVLWSVVQRILGGKELGSLEVNGVFWGESGWMLGVEEWRWMLGFQVRFGEGLGEIWEAEEGSVAREGMLSFLQKEGGGEFGLSRSLSGSFLAGKRW